MNYFPFVQETLTKNYKYLTLGVKYNSNQHWLKIMFLKPNSYMFHETSTKIWKILKKIQNDQKKNKMGVWDNPNVFLKPPHLPLY